MGKYFIGVVNAQCLPDSLSLGTMYQYEIIDTAIYSVMESALYQADFCPCNILNDPFMGILTLEDSTICIEVLPYNVGVISHLKKIPIQKKGFFYYKNILIVFQDQDFGMNYNSIFHNTNCKKDIRYQWDGNLLNLIYPADNSVIQYYSYIENAFHKIEFDGRECENTRGIYYIVKKEDDWHSISNKWHCNTTDLKMDESSSLESGTLIVLEQYFNTNRLIKTIRIQ